MAGAGYKLFNTGDVLTAAQVNTYLMEQTVMVFDDAAARTTALSGVVSEGMISYLKDTNAVEVYNGSAWVASDDPNAIQNTIVDAKGDLIAASAADTPARLAVGANGETLVADSSASTGLRWQPNFSVGRNKILNSDFGIWQRGTSFVNQLFASDRWRTVQDGNGTQTVSQQTFSPGTAPVAGYEGQFFLRNTTTSVGTSTYQEVQQRIEDVRTLANQTVTVSFWAKADSNRTATLFLEQNFGSGGSGSVYPILSQSVSLTSSWQRFTYTVSLASLSGKTIGSNSFLAFFIRFPAASGAVCDLWGVQIEAGNTATAFQTATGTLAGELAACQRYYYRQGGANVYQTVAQGWGVAGGAIQIKVVTPVTMRTTPTTLDSGSLIFFDQSNAGIAVTGLSIVTNQSSPQVVYLTSTTTTGTQYRPYDLSANNTTAAFLGLGAEL